MLDLKIKKILLDCSPMSLCCSLDTCIWSFGPSNLEFVLPGCWYIEMINVEQVSFMLFFLIVVVGGHPPSRILMVTPSWNQLSFLNLLGWDLVGVWDKGIGTIDNIL